ncbi:MAG: hypothetical protein ACK5Z4_10295, partial [Planctomyces sp.]
QNSQSPNRDILSVDGILAANMDLSRMALPLAAQGFTAMADALATTRGPWVGWSWPTAPAINVRPVRTP